MPEFKRQARTMAFLYGTHELIGMLEGGVEDAYERGIVIAALEIHKAEGITEMNTSAAGRAI